MKSETANPFSTRFDAALLTFAAVALGFEVLLLLSQLRLIPDLWDSAVSPQSVTLAKLTTQKASVNRRKQASLSWYPLRPGDPVFENDTVMTGPSAAANIELDAGGMLELGELSLIQFKNRVTDAGAPLSIDLERGSVQVRASATNTKLQIAEHTVLLAPESELTLSSPGESLEPDLRVSKGVVQVVSRDKRTQIQAGESVRLDGASQVRTPAPPPARPAIRYFLQGGIPIVKAKQNRAVYLAWSAVKEADSYAVEISADREFRAGVRTVITKGIRLALPPQPPGKLYWRLRARSLTWGEWAPSDPVEIRIRKQVDAPKVKGGKILRTKKPSSTSLLAPARGARVGWASSAIHLFFSAWVQTALATEKSPEPIVLELAWEPVHNARAYWVEVSDRSDFKALLFTAKAGQTSAVARVPDREKYYWRVASIDDDGDRGAFTAPQSIRKDEVKPAAQSEPPKPTMPLPPAVLAKIDLPAAPPKWTRWFGYGVQFFSQSSLASGYSMWATGVPMNRVVAGVSRQTSTWEWDLHLWVQPLVYRRSQGVVYQRLFPGGELVGKTILSGLPVLFGARARTEAFVSGHTATSIQMDSSNFGAFLFGSYWQVSGKWPWKSTLALELGPLWGRSGAGLLWRNRVGIPYSLWGLSPAVELLFHPQYRTTGSAPKPEWNWEVSAVLILAWGDGVEQ